MFPAGIALPGRPLCNPIVLGETLSVGIRSFSQAGIIYLLALLLGVEIYRNPLALLGVPMGIVVGVSFISVLADYCLVKTREPFMGSGQALILPMSRACNAIYPLARMPGWPQAVARVKPLTYEGNALRALTLS